MGMITTHYALCTQQGDFPARPAPNTPQLGDASPSRPRCNASDEYKRSSSSLHDLWRRRRRQLRPKHPVPEPAGDTEAILVVHEVMLQVVLLQRAVV